MTILEKIQLKIQDLLDEIKALKEENAMLKLTLKSAIKSKGELVSNNNDMYSKITLALKNSKPLKTSQEQDKNE